MYEIICTRFHCTVCHDDWFPAHASLSIYLMINQKCACARLKIKERKGKEGGEEGEEMKRKGEGCLGDSPNQKSILYSVN